MKIRKLLLPLLMSTTAALPVVAATPLLGADLASFSMLAGGYATYGANTLISNRVGAVSYITGGAGSSSAGNDINNAAVTASLSQLDSAQTALFGLGQGTVLGATMAGNVNLSPGVYSASALTTAAGTVLTLDGGGAENPFWIFNVSTYLVTGASTQIQLINAGAGANVLWNTGGYTTLGADTTFVGAILSQSYISQGAGAMISCGNAFAKSYISTPANVTVNSSSCAGSGSWAGSVNGLGTTLAIVDGAAMSTLVSVVPEPETLALMLAGLCALGFKLARDRRTL